MPNNVNNQPSGSGPRVRPIRREHPDLAKLARALIMLAQSKHLKQPANAPASDSGGDASSSEEAA